MAVHDFPRGVRSVPKTTSLNSVGAAPVFSTRMRRIAPSQLLNMNRAKRAAGKRSSIVDRRLALDFGDASFGDPAPSVPMLFQVLAYQCAVVGGFGAEITEEATAGIAACRERLDAVIEVGFQPVQRRQIRIAEEGPQIVLPEPE